MSKDRSIYILLSSLSFLGLTWTFKNLIQGGGSISYCPIKYITGFPCPACGSTRSVVQIVQGDFVDGFLLNPLGYVITVFLFVIPFWVIMDITAKKNTLPKVYRQSLDTIRKRAVAIPLIITIIGNWLWNINKGL